MRQIEAMLACVAVAGTVLYGPVSRGVERVESKAAPIVRAMEQGGTVEQASVQMIELPAMIQVPEAPAPPEVARVMCAQRHEAARMHAKLAKDQAKMRRELARQNAELAREVTVSTHAQVRMQMQRVHEQVREAMQHVRMERASYSIPLG